MSFILLCGFILCCSLVRCYKIDQSCHDAGVADKVETAIQSAFDMAQSGLDALERSFRTTPGANVPPRAPELQELIKHVFAHDKIINNAQPPVPNDRISEYNYQTHMRNVQLRNVYRSFEGILTNFKLPGITNFPGEKDVIVFCDDKRVDFPQGKDADYAISGGVKIAYKGTDCFGSDAGTVFAWTFTRLVTRGPGDRKDHPSEIQLCQPLVEFLQNARIITMGSFREKTLITKVKSKLLEHRLFNFKQIDAFNLVDLTLLHEMTHTASGKASNDVKVKGGISSGWEMVKAYEWSKIKKLAKEGPFVDRASRAAADHNADSIAYFGMICKMMSEQQNPARVTEFGNIEPMQNQIDWQPSNW